jgi:hypothetical protein
LLAIPAFQRISAHHTSPHEAGLVFERAHPKLAVYTHIVRMSSPIIPVPSLADIVAETRQTYRGPLVVGEDLMTFSIGTDVSPSIAVFDDPRNNADLTPSAGRDGASFTSKFRFIAFSNALRGRPEPRRSLMYSAPSPPLPWPW